MMGCKSVLLKYSQFLHINLYIALIIMLFLGILFRIYKYKKQFFGLTQSYQMKYNKKYFEEDESNFTEQSTETPIIKKSMINKSTIRVASFINSMLKQIPEVSLEIQKLNITNNHIYSINIHLPKLKQLIAERNFIEQIPEQYNKMKNLLILRLNHNRISRIPYLKNIKHLEILYNPLEFITSMIVKMQLSIFLLDWTQFLFHDSFGKQQNFNQFIKLLNKLQTNNEFITFDEVFFKHHGKQPYLLSLLIHKAITHNYYFFIKFVIEHIDLNFNQLYYLGSPLIFFALERQYQPSYKLFQLGSIPEYVYLRNLRIILKASNFQLFQFFMKKYQYAGLIATNLPHLISDTLLSFNSLKKSNKIILRLMQFMKSNSIQKTKLLIPKQFSISQVDNIANGLEYLIQNFSYFIDFEGQQTQTLDYPLIHFITLTKKTQLLIYLLHENINPLRRNSTGILARSMRGASPICRKLLWKTEKYLRNNLLIKNNHSNKGLSLSYRLFEHRCPSKINYKHSQLTQQFDYQQLYQYKLISKGLQVIDKYLNEKQKDMKETQDNVLIIKPLLLKRINDELSVITEKLILRSPKSFTSSFITKQTNSLISFELFNALQTENIKHDYDMSQQATITSQYSWNICQNVASSNHEIQYKSEKIKRNKFQITL